MITFSELSFGKHLTVRFYTINKTLIIYNTNYRKTIKKEDLSLKSSHFQFLWDIFRAYFPNHKKCCCY